MFYILIFITRLFCNTAGQEVQIGSATPGQLSVKRSSHNAGRVPVKLESSGTEVTVHESNRSVTTLTLPQGWHFLRSEDLSFEYRSASRTLLMIAREENSGNWDFQGVHVYRRNGNRWIRLNYKPALTKFSNRGGALIKGNTFYVWDIVYDERYAHKDPQLYFLKKFIIKDNRIILVCHRTTKRRYRAADIYEDALPPVSDDPLKEFGMRWSSYYKQLQKR